MKYWGFFAAKVAVCAALLYGAGEGMARLLPSPGPFFGPDLIWTLAGCVFFVICTLVLWVCIVDQRYRCRVCLRRLRMPIESGSWGSMLQLGRPRIEYICPFGHGTLKVSEVQIAGLEMPDWKENQDMWTELSGKPRK